MCERGGWLHNHSLCLNLGAEVPHLKKGPGGRSGGQPTLKLLTLFKCLLAGLMIAQTGYAQS